MRAAVWRFMTVGERQVTVSVVKQVCARVVTLFLPLEGGLHIPSSRSCPGSPQGWL